jgi:NAD(P)-dependent dehydrogenase (short-subunit alcohol dehydrogenase family)
MTMTHGLQDLSVLITGANGGIGRASALAFARAGARLMLADLDAAAGADLVARARALGAEAAFWATDVTREAEVTALVAACVVAYGRLDCAFNNAGIEIENGPITECDEATFERIMAVNVKGVWLCMKHELRQMEAQGGGAIVNTASVAGLVGAPRLPVYCGSKHAVLGLTKSAAAGFAAKNVRVNAVCPGVIRTPMVQRWVDRDPDIMQRVTALHPMGRIGEPEEVAAVVLWLCSPAASFVTGLAHTVDGAYITV